MKNAGKATMASAGLQILGSPFKSHGYNYTDSLFISAARGAKAINRKYGVVQGIFEFIGDVIH